LIPGHDALLELAELWEGDPDKGSDKVADRSLQAVNLDGDALGTLSLKLGGSEANRAPHSIVCSQHAVAYVLNDVGTAYVRVYAIVGKSGGTQDE
ncbi:MAG TPA: hypothetical protein VM492_12830, partial [Sumerlaeia bacterium]|nr:hypothetical protein [Sumerlaeia bacterium]